MASASVEGAQVRAAKIAGLTYLLSFVTVVSVNFGVIGRLAVAADPARTARNILEQETFFRVGLAGNVLYCVAVVILVASLYVVLRPVGETLALVAALFRLVHSFTWLLVSVNLFTGLRLLTRPEYARVFPEGQLFVLARLYLSSFDQYYVGLLFWSLGVAIGAYLWLKSGYIAKWLAVYGLVASVWCAACTSILFVVPTFQKVVSLWWFDIPMVLFETVLSVLLLVHGLRVSGPAGAQ